MCKVKTYRLGDFIREVDVRNRDFQCDNLLGLSISKEFVPSIANTIGTDLRSYKIVHNDQFAYVPVTSRNGEKITVAHYVGETDCIVSQAYTVFEVTKPHLLSTDYLMIWFRRPEFDRYARYMSHGSAREVFGWEEMCETSIPVPSIEEQRSIVARHKAIINRIQINTKSINTLESLAQTIYRRMFVDGIDPNTLPKGWSQNKIGDVFNIVYGKGLLTDKLTKDGYLVYGGNGVIGHFSSYLYERSQVLISCRGVASGTIHRTRPFSFVTSNSLVCEITDERIGTNYAYYSLRRKGMEQYQSGSAQPQITVGDISSVTILTPPKDITQLFEKRVQPLVDHISIIEDENIILSSLMEFLTN